ncbi:MAG: hypothetical protein IJF67_18400 [Clostridia bacterium]|nr:hypothetical protein [Clostridia bacterium]
MRRFCLILAGMLALALPLSANSVQRYWSGTTGTGTFAAGGSCPLIAEHETLTFSLGELPSNHYFTAEDYLAYSGSVTAEYTFYNPADYEVTATLVFPFGKASDYAYLVHPEEVIGYLPAVDLKKYGVAVDGAAADVTVRHTLSHAYAPFDLDTDLPRLIDDFAADDFYSPELPVRCVKYTAWGIDAAHRSARAAIVWRGDERKTRIYLEGMTGAETLDKGVRLEVPVQNGTEITLWIIGEVPELPGWTLYENGACETEIAGRIEMLDEPGIEQRAPTFRDFALQKWQADSGILESDWYNAMVAALGQERWKHGILRVEGGLDLSASLLSWYEYELRVPAGGRVVNTVTAPMYPSIDSRWEPPQYYYLYLLSPASSWSDFGTLDVEIITPYYMTSCSLDGFAKTETGYSASFDGLPAGELTFMLCTSESPQRLAMGRGIGRLLLAVPVILLGGAGIFTVVWAAKRHRES